MKNDVVALVVVAVAVLAVSRRARRAAWTVLRGAGGALLAVAAVVVERRRRLERPARQQLPAVRRWHVRLSARVDGHMVVIASGDVVGPWTTAAEVRDETLRRWAEAGGWAIGDRRIYCEAWPLAPATRPNVNAR